MVRKARRYGTGIIERPKGSGQWSARIVFRGRQHWRRAANKDHARELYHEMKAAIRQREYPPKPEARPVLFDGLLEDYREAKRREGKAVMASNIGYRRLLTAPGGGFMMNLARVWYPAVRQAGIESFP